MTEHVKQQSITASFRPYVYRHVVSFEETNVVGNVYFSNHLAWQGRCRELFLKDHTPEILTELSKDFRLVTLKASCEYFEEVFALDDVEIRMFLVAAQSNRIGLKFEYLVNRRGTTLQAALGAQELACMRATERGLIPISIPASLSNAFSQYGATSLRLEPNQF